MARYTFTVSTGAESIRPQHSAELKDEAAALAHACNLTRKIRAAAFGSHSPR